MKNGKSPTKKQKIVLTENKLDYNNWLVIEDDKNKMVIQNRKSGKIKSIIKWSNKET